MKASERFLQSKRLNRWDRFSLLSEVQIYRDEPVYDWQSLKEARNKLVAAKKDSIKYLQEIVRCGSNLDKDWYDDVKNYVLTVGWEGRVKLP